MFYLSDYDGKGGEFSTLNLELDAEIVVFDDSTGRTFPIRFADIYRYKPFGYAKVAGVMYLYKMSKWERSYESVVKSISHVRPVAYDYVSKEYYGGKCDDTLCIVPDIMIYVLDERSCGLFECNGHTYSGMAFLYMLQKEYPLCNICDYDYVCFWSSGDVITLHIDTKRLAQYFGKRSVLCGV